MAIPYHTHTFEFQTATKDDVIVGVDTAKVVVSAALGSAAANDTNDFATAAQGRLADSAVQKDTKIIVEEGLQGGGSLHGDITLSLSQATQDSLKKADGAAQDKDLGALAKKDKIDVIDIGATGGGDGAFLRFDGSWSVPDTTSADMNKSVYDPYKKEKNIYNADNIDEGGSHFFLTADERQSIKKNTNNIIANTTDIAANTYNINNNKENIATNTADITTNTNNIATILKSQNTLVGQVSYFPFTSPPDGWLKANGALLNRADFPLLWEAVQKYGRVVTEEDWVNGNFGTFSEGDGSKTFRIPEYRGEILRAWDDGRGVDANRLLGSYQGDAIRNITGWFAANGPANSTFGLLQANDIGSALDGAFKVGQDLGLLEGTQVGSKVGNTKPVAFDASRVVPTANENRPRNIALLACIRYM